MIVRFSGGLGNQMFQYAFFLELRHRFPQWDIRCDLGDYDRYRHHNGYELHRIFGINAPMCSEQEIEKHRIKMTIPYKVLRRLGVQAGYPKCVREPNGYTEGFWEDIKEEDFLWGYWQKEQYFSNIKDVVRKSFVFPEIDSHKNHAFAERIHSVNSVSIHIRRGDYLTSNSLGLVNLCQTDYYRRAIELAYNRLKHPIWFVFSDDVAWCRSNLGLAREAEFVDWNGGANAYCDMQLMSQCKHNIIANSTFSWWGAWLNNTPEKVVISPSVFYGNNPQFNRDVICEGWVTVVPE